MAYLGIDLGGTKVNTAKIVGQSCENIWRSLIPRDGTEEEVLAVIIASISEVIDKDVKGIGIGVPSVVDQDLGIVYDVQNIPSWKKVYLKDKLEAHYNLPVFVNNDANCFALGELHFGLGYGLSSFIGLTIGTGIAGGIIINKKLYNGQNTGAGEFGMLPYLEENFEHYCSGHFFQKYHGVTGEKLFEAAEEDKKEALVIFEDFGKHLGNLILQIMYTYDPGHIILGGSVSKGYPFFKKGIDLSLERFAFQGSISKLNLLVSNDPYIAVKGAAALCNTLKQN